MDSDTEDEILAEWEDSHSDQETDASSESSSHQMSKNKILILSAESLSSAEKTKFVLQPELDLGSFNTTGKGKPVIIKPQPIVSSDGTTQYILHTEPPPFSFNEEKNGLQIQNGFHGSCKERRPKKKSRERNVTSLEKNTLFKICKKYPELGDKTCNNETNNRKRKAWEGIHEEFIATCLDPESKDRSIKFLQGCWSRFVKKSRKARRTVEAHNAEEETTTEVVSFHAAPSLTGKESQPSHTSECLNGIVSTKNTSASNSVLSTSDSLVSRTKTVTSNTQPLLSSDSNSVPCSGDSVLSGEKASKASIANTTAESLLQVNRQPRYCLNSEYETKPPSIRFLRRKALELAVEVEKEKLAAFRYQREAEHERLVAMKLQKSAQKYALMVEKEKYETELLKKEAVRLSLEKEKHS